MTDRRTFMLCCAGVLVVTAAAPLAGAQTGPAAVPPPAGITQTWARIGNDSVAAAYGTLFNNTDRPLKLVAARSARAARIELHRTTMTNGVMEMRPVEAIEVPARGTVVLAPGGLHFMLIGLTAPLRAGERISITPIFEGEPERAYTFEVFPAGHPGPGKR